MKNNNFSIDGFIRDAEQRFSGFAGDDYYQFEGEDIQFNGDDQFYYGAAGQQEPAISPTPYQVIFDNTLGIVNATAVLFGVNKWLLSPNFGSSVGLIVTPAQGNVSYLELLQQSGGEPFETSLLRIQTTNPTQLTTIIDVISKDANGQQATIPIITQSYFSANQFQGTILDIPYNLKVNSNVWLTWTVLPATLMSITLFPRNKVNTSRPLAGLGAMKQYGSPAVSIGIPTVAVKPLVSGGMRRIQQ